jgi:hypothetical protein
VNNDLLNPINLFGGNTDKRKIELLPELKEYFIPKGGPAVVATELAKRQRYRDLLMSNVREVAARGDKGKSSGGSVKSTSLGPPVDLPKIKLSGSKRSLSVMKTPEPNFRSPKVAPLSEGSRVIKKASNSSRGKGVSEVFVPVLEYLDGEVKKQVMTTDSAIDNPMVARALSEGLVLSPDAELVNNTDLLVQCDRVNSALITVSYPTL